MATPTVRIAGAAALITGAGSGIGRATAIEFARHRMSRLVLVDINAETLERTAQLLPASTHVEQHLVDVSDGDAMERLAALLDGAGVLDIIVNNAGIGVAGPFLSTPPEVLDRLVGVNLWGVVHGCRLFGSRLMERGRGGHIVNVASAAAFAPSAILPAYSMTKAAVLMLSECLRAELAQHRIGVSAICPGIVNTAIVRSTMYVGEEGVFAERRRNAVRLYEQRNYGPERVAQRIVAAIRRNVAVMPVAPEAYAVRGLVRLSPGLARLLAQSRPL
ncbi:MAG: SDR family NAD(P)-dependent oxidoreductase [Candidatus Dormibacteraeota bacterium]|nr:SDR family NAD(P)-dependent oxidoreductase [Candidatus Dormibacteraeota bacterium]